MVASFVRTSSTFSKDFFSEITGTISFKFNMQLKDKDAKVYIFRSGRMTKMAAMPIYGKNLKPSSPEPLSRLL